jgi:hypothetical protein
MISVLPPQTAQLNANSFIPILLIRSDIFRQETTSGVTLIIDLLLDVDRPDTVLPFKLQDISDGVENFAFVTSTPFVQVPALLRYDRGNLFLD